jgi:hypothetical protein
MLNSRIDRAPHIFDIAQRVALLDAIGSHTEPIQCELVAGPGGSEQGSMLSGVHGVGRRRMMRDLRRVVRLTRSN